ncbi:inositol 2-dehydrogenase [Methylovirgula sp. 4M-Z18]|uniref:inositol 2-dehydrogenase n=1 Tax=Methylovirgula sp. 4M-Z18 TaxID=2293567 RepID=UPI000E2F5579|nr:inositol 2-dehydrogenase [Methylovirgula sp. 4M-Z18]RFB78504.1 inositol 2-dehydrogenase [Methylovirgula sp. 4M-Z18]
MRFGLIGAGRIGRIHGGNVAAHKGTELALVADADAKAAADVAAQYGAKVADIAGIMADKNIDAVLICAPTDMHSDLIEQAARAGKAIFCEKPVDLNADRIKACLKVVNEAKAPLMIGFNRRFDPNFAALQQRLHNGAVGNVEIVTVISRDPSPPPVSYIGRSGGLFRDMMIHDFDMARFLLDEEPIAVTAVGSSLVDPEIGKAGDVDTAAVLLETKSGKIAQISNSRRATYGYDQRIEVHGAKGMIRAGNVHETSVEVATGQGFTGDPVQNFFLERYANAYRLELEAFINAVEKGVAPAPSGEDGLRAQLIADAATESWRAKKRVEIGA